VYLRIPENLLNLSSFIAPDPLSLLLKERGLFNLKMNGIMELPLPPAQKRPAFFFILNLRIKIILLA